jgi:hypothetical protein
VRLGLIRTELCSDGSLVVVWIGLIDENPLDTKSINWKHLYDDLSPLIDRVGPAKRELGSNTTPLSLIMNTSRDGSCSCVS